LSCFVCEKHRAVDAVLADEHVVVSHLPLTTPSGGAETAYLGHLIVEPRRHVTELGDLDADESAAFGRAAAQASAALQAYGAEHVYAAVIGHGVDHLHLHLIPRYPGTPREFWWTRVDEWPDAPRGGAAEIAALTRRLRSLL
jgi:diadenosine tetraphosphate (Ap4A) HIT family hydrolase